jgi:hypothetical protein
MRDNEDSQVANEEQCMVGVINMRPCPGSMNLGEPLSHLIMEVFFFFFISHNGGIKYICFLTTCIYCDFFLKKKLS